MRFFRPVSRLCCIALLLGLIADRAAAQIGRVGDVVKDDVGQPIKGATVIADNPNIGQSFTATSDDKGRFQMIGLRTGQWRFLAQAPGFEPQAGQMGVRMGAPNPPVVFTMKKDGVANYGPLGGVSNRDLQRDLSAADALYEQGKWDNAAEAYRAVIARSPSLNVINLQVGAAYRNKKDYPAAIAAYTALLKDDPANEKAHLGIALAHRERGDETAAEEELTRTADTANAGREIFFTLGEWKYVKNDMAAAAQWYRKAATADPLWGKPLYMLGLCAIKAGDANGASTLMAQVLSVDPTSPEAALAKSSLESLKK